jgi:hypothetical protein
MLTQVEDLVLKPDKAGRLILARAVPATRRRQ